MYEMPLSGINVLDLSQFVAGPYASQLLAFQGADVVSVEPPGGSQERGGNAASFSIVGREKKSLSIDLKQPEGKDTLRELLKDTDVFIHNYGPETIDRLGLSHESVTDVNDEIIYVSITACGETGMYSDRVGFDPIAQAMSGLMWNTGEPDRKPSRVGTSPVDLCTGLFAAFATTSALIDKRSSNSKYEGTKIEVSLLETAAELMNWMYTNHSLGDEPHRLGHAWYAYAPCGAFNTADEPVYLAAWSQNQWRSLCEALDRDEWVTDPRFETRELRKSNREELHELIEDEMEAYSREDVITMMGEYSVPVGEVHSVEEAVNDPYLREQETVVDVTDINGENVVTTTTPLDLSEMPQFDMQNPRYADVGEHSRELLRQTGLSTDEIEELVSQNVVRVPEDGD